MDDGGPVFSYDGRAIVGMTLRDWFAGQVLANANANARDYAAFEIAKYAYYVADAMSQQRNQGES